MIIALICFYFFFTLFSVTSLIPPSFTVPDSAKKHLSNTNTHSVVIPGFREPLFFYYTWRRKKYKTNRSKCDLKCEWTHSSIHLGMQGLFSNCMPHLTVWAPTLPSCGNGLSPAAANPPAGSLHSFPLPSILLLYFQSEASLTTTTKTQIHTHHTHVFGAASSSD